jgi:hypothetical protein
MYCNFQRVPAAHYTSKDRESNPDCTALLSLGGPKNQSTHRRHLLALQLLCMSDMMALQSAFPSAEDKVEG